MLGLQRGRVKLVRHNPQWKKSFTREAEKLRKVFGRDALDIQHVGSTAILGVLAKPIIDLAVIVPSPRTARRHIPVLRRIGYQLKREARTGRLFFTKGSARKRTHYLHVGKSGSGYVEDIIIFRDYLRSHHSAAREYAALKEKLSARYRHERDHYTERKGKFIAFTLREATRT